MHRITAICRRNYCADPRLLQHGTVNHSPDSGRPPTGILSPPATQSHNQQQESSSLSNHHRNSTSTIGIGAQIYQHSDPKIRSCANWVNLLPPVFSPIPQNNDDEDDEDGIELASDFAIGPQTVRKRKATAAADEEEPKKQTPRIQPETGDADRLAGTTVTTATAFSASSRRSAAILLSSQQQPQQLPRTSPTHEMLKRVRFALRSSSVKIQTNAANITSTPDAANSSANESADRCGPPASKRVRFNLNRKPTKTKASLKQITQTAGPSIESTTASQ